MSTIGLVELYVGEAPTVDIIAVHGLNGDVLKTWTHESAELPWLSDPTLIPSKIPNARILSWGYNADVAALLGSTSSDRILQHAQTLVAQVQADREIEGAETRPIIWLCHSLGGIVVKRRLSVDESSSTHLVPEAALSFTQYLALAYAASRTSKSIAHLHSIFVSTYAILFFGTPHNGSDRAKLASTAQRMFSSVAPKKMVDTQSHLLDALQAGSETLQNITDQFAPLMKQFHIYFFWEQEKTGLGYTWDYIVEESSAAPILDNIERSGIAANHSKMCKFQDKNSPGYRTVLAALMRYSRDAPATIKVRWIQADEMLHKRRVNEASEMTGL